MRASRHTQVPLRSYHRGASRGMSTRGARARTVVTCKPCKQGGGLRGNRKPEWAASACAACKDWAACAARLQVQSQPTCLHQKLVRFAGAAGIVQPQNAQQLGTRGKGPCQHLWARASMSRKADCDDDDA